MNVQTTILVPVSDAQYNRLVWVTSPSALRRNQNSHHLAIQIVGEALPFAVGEEFFLDGATFLALTVKSKAQTYSVAGRGYDSTLEIDLFCDLNDGFKLAWTLYVERAISDGEEARDFDHANS